MREDVELLKALHEGLGRMGHPKGGASYTHSTKGGETMASMKKFTSYILIFLQFLRSFF